MSKELTNHGKQRSGDRRSQPLALGEELLQGGKSAARDYGPFQIGPADVSWLPRQHIGYKLLPSFTDSLLWQVSRGL